MIELWNDCKYNKKTTQPVFTCSKSKMETRAQRVKSAQLTIKTPEGSQLMLFCEYYKIFNDTSGGCFCIFRLFLRKKFGAVDQPGPNDENLIFNISKGNIHDSNTPLNNKNTNITRILYFNQLI